MNNLEMINDIFEKTKAITKSIIQGVENPQMTSVMNYLLATSVYLNGREEISRFKKNWVKISNKIKPGIEGCIWEKYYRTIHNNVRQAPKEEEDNNSDLAYFYQDTFLRMYGEAKIKHDNFNKNFGDRRREHYEYIFSTKENFEEALRRGDSAAFCD